MKEKLANLSASIRQYRFELRHLTVLFVVLIIFQIILSLVHKLSLEKILLRTQEWYQQDSAERLANLTATSLELLLEAKSKNQQLGQNEVNKIIGDLNIILSQQYLHQNVQEICLIVSVDSTLYAIDDGGMLFSYIFEDNLQLPLQGSEHQHAVQLYKGIQKEFRTAERIHTIVEHKQMFHTFVPFVPRGEFAGALYMKNTPDFSVFTDEMISAYDETAITYTALIFFGLLAMFYISTYTLRERNKAQQLLFDEQKKHLADQINTQNELLFTKRIYHTHHKAEKIMGFIKEDLRQLTTANIDMIKMRINKYANFIARVIYDMKWYEPPLQTIRSNLFKTNINAVLEFLIQNVFNRISVVNDGITFQLDLDKELPVVHLNEFVVWEVFEPILQNAVDHAAKDNIIIKIQTIYNKETGLAHVCIIDNGVGIEPWLLEKDESGIKKIFHEHTSTKIITAKRHSGYGCYIAYEIAKQRCGWELDAENLPNGGSKFIFTISFH